MTHYAIVFIVFLIALVILITIPISFYNFKIIGDFRISHSILLSVMTFLLIQMRKKDE